MKTFIALFLCLFCVHAQAEPPAQASAVLASAPAATLLKADTLSGKQILKLAVDAAGGDAWQQPKSLELRGDAVWTPYGRTDAANQLRFDDYALYRIFPVDNDSARQANGKVRIDAKAAKVPFLQLIFDSLFQY